MGWGLSEVFSLVSPSHPTPQNSLWALNSGDCKVLIFLRVWSFYFHGEIKGRFRKRVVLANVPSFRFSFRGNIRRNHPFGNHPFGNHPFGNHPFGSLGDKRAVSKRVVLANVPLFRFSFRGNIRQNHPFGNHPFANPRYLQDFVFCKGVSLQPLLSSGFSRHTLEVKNLVQFVAVNTLHRLLFLACFKYVWNIYSIVSFEDKHKKGQKRAQENDWNTQVVLGCSQIIIMVQS